jgi:hypothetical protein
MPDTTQEELLRLFEEAAGDQGSGDELGEAFSLAGSAGSSEGTTDTAPKGDPNPNTPARTSTGNTGITAESVATTVLESGLGLVPLITGIIGLFEGSHPAPEVFTKYAMPDSIQFEGDTSSGATGIDGFDQMGMPRTDATTPDGAPTQTMALQGATTPTNGATATTISQPGASPQTTAQPGDPQWFMDHSNDIAQAVRSAMLNLSSLNDVMSDL